MQTWTALGLPAPSTPMVGRESEVAAVCERLRDPVVRIVTLTGAGGVGKSRVALEAAAVVGDDFVDGVAFVPLAAVHDPDLVPSAVAQQLGLRSAGGRPATELLQEFLRPRESLLVLDSFEHVIEAAPLASALVSACPGLKLLITSRETLNVSGEHELPVPPLQTTSAVTLFCQRAQAAHPDFDANAPAVAAICARLNGLPLALELAASRAKLLGADAILTRLERRLELLTRGPRDLPERQRTMRGTIKWSYDLLDETEQRVFRALCVFVGGFTIDAAATICDVAGGPPVDVLDTIASLVDKSMLHRVAEAGEDGRVGILDTIREYGLEELRAAGELDRVRGAHAAYHLALAEEGAARLSGPEQIEWLDRLETEHGNLRAALRTAVDGGDAVTAVRLAGALGRFWYLHGPIGEGSRWLDQALELAADWRDPARVRALHAASILTYHRGDYGRAQDLGEQGHELARQLGDEQGVTLALEALGLVARATGRYDDARIMCDECISICRRRGDRRQLAEALARASMVLSFQGDYDGAEPIAAEAAGIMRELGDREGLARASVGHAFALLGRGEDDAARELLEASLAEMRAIGTWRWTTRALANLGVIAARQGDAVLARSRLEDAAAISLESGEPMYAAVSVFGLAHVMMLAKRPELAARLLGAAAATRDALGGAVPDPVRVDEEADMIAARDALGDDRFASALAEGRAMTLEQALAALPPAGVEPVPDQPGGLTTRELEVLRLVASGASDAEVAEALVVSRRTVHAHLRSVYRKLDVRSRSAATRYALDHGLAT